MRVFLTGATGFIGTAIADELIGAGHSVLGVARNDAAADLLTKRGILPHLGDLRDHDSFISGAQACDAVIHCAFIHDFSKFTENIEIEHKTVAAMLEALAGSEMPFIATSGIAMLAPGRTATEEDRPLDWGRGATENLVLGAASRGLRTSVIRLPPITHENGEGGFLPALAQIARAKGVSAYVGDGENRWPAGHRRDAAHLYRLALKKGEPGASYMAVADEGLAMRDIAAAIGAKLGLPTASVSNEEAQDHFGWLGMFIGTDMPASSQITREHLGWRPSHTGLLQDIATAQALGAR